MVVDSVKAVIHVADYVKATSQIALTTLRSVLGQSDLDELLFERDKINKRLREIIDQHTEPWGVMVSVVEVKDVQLPDPMQRPWQNKQKQKGRNGPKSSMPRANSRPQKPFARLPESFPSSLLPFNCVTFRH